MMNPTLRLVGKILGILAVIVLVLGGMIWYGNAQDHANDPQKLVVAVNDQDWFEGGKDATVTLVEYSDFQCPACGAYFPLIQELHETYGDALKIVYRNFPLVAIHSNAQLAAQAAEAAGMQGKFFLMHDLLFGNQKTWSDEADPTAIFVSYATTLGLDVGKFTADLTSDAVKNSIEDDVKSGNASSVNSTPTFFLNGLQIVNNPRSIEAFTALIDAAMDPAPVVTP